MKILGLRICVALLTFLVGVLAFLSFNLFNLTAFNSINFEVPPVETRAVTFACPTMKGEQDPGRFWPSGVDDDTEVEQFWASFQQAVATDDKKKVVAMATYPLRVNYYDDAIEDEYRSVRNRKAFLKVYDRIFDNDLKAMIANTSIRDIWANYRGIATPRGGIWIGVFCIDNKVECRHEIKLRTIHANSAFIERK